MLTLYYTRNARTAREMCGRLQIIETSVTQVDKYNHVLGPVRLQCRTQTLKQLLKQEPNVSQFLLYGLECFQLGKADLQSLDFTFNCLCMKLFKTGSIDMVKDCLSCFAIDLPSCVCKKGKISSYCVIVPQ